MPCTHPAASLKADSAEQPRPGVLTVKFCCVSCLAPLTKEFLLKDPEPVKPAEGLEDLVEMNEMPTPKIRRGANTPWRNLTSASKPERPSGAAAFSRAIWWR